jgi:hypothetical protein
LDHPTFVRKFRAGKLKVSANFRAGNDRIAALHAIDPLTGSEKAWLGVMSAFGLWCVAGALTHGFGAGRVPGAMLQAYFVPVILPGLILTGLMLYKPPGGLVIQRAVRNRTYYELAVQSGVLMVQPKA